MIHRRLFYQAISVTTHRSKLSAAIPCTVRILSHGQVATSTTEPIMSAVLYRSYSASTNQHSTTSHQYDNHHDTTTSQKQQQQQQQQSQNESAISTPNDNHSNNTEEMPSLQLKNERLPCAQHLDPDGTVLPTSEWIHINGTLPICSLEQVLQSVTKWLQEEEIRGIIHLDALWNPIQDSYVPTLKFSMNEDDDDKDDDTNIDTNTDTVVDNNDTANSDSPEDLTTTDDGSTILHGPLIEAAHVVISPFGRPNGWHVKLANRSLVNAILSRAQEQHISIAWKVVQVTEHYYHPNQDDDNNNTEAVQDYAKANGLVVDDTMVRIENCPSDLKDEYVRYILSRYDLAPNGNTVIRWNGQTTDGKVAPLMYVVRFADASWARAAVRELQSTIINGKEVKFIQYPKQMRYQGM